MTGTPGRDGQGGRTGHEQNLFNLLSSASVEPDRSRDERQKGRSRVGDTDLASAEDIRATARGAK